MYSRLFRSSSKLIRVIFRLSLSLRCGFFWKIFTRGKQRAWFIVSTTGKIQNNPQPDPYHSETTDQSSVINLLSSYHRNTSESRIFSFFSNRAIKFIPLVMREKKGKPQYHKSTPTRERERDGRVARAWCLLDQRKPVWRGWVWRTYTLLRWRFFRRS